VQLAIIINVVLVSFHRDPTIAIGKPQPLIRRWQHHAAAFGVFLVWGELMLMVRKCYIIYNKRIDLLVSFLDWTSPNLRHLRADVHHGGQELQSLFGRLRLLVGGLRAQLLRPLSKLPKLQRWCSRSSSQS